MFGRIGKARKTAALTACFMLFGGATTMAQPVKLRWKFTTGRALKYRITQTNVIERQGGEKPIRVSWTQIMDMTWVVDSVNSEGAADMTQTIDRLQLKMSGGPAGDIAYDSASEKAPEGIAALMAPMCDAIVDEPIRLRMSALGKITEVVLSEETSEKIKKAPKVGPLSEMFSEAALTQTMSAGTLQFASNLVDVGDSWHNASSMSTPGLGKQETTTTFIYQGMAEHKGRKVAKIDVKNRVNLVEDKDSAAKVSLDEQESDGIVYFDPAASQVVDMKAINKLTVTLTAGEQKMTQSFSSRSSMEPLSSAASGKKTLKLDSSSSSGK